MSLPVDATLLFRKNTSTWNSFFIYIIIAPCNSQQPQFSKLLVHLKRSLSPETVIIKEKTIICIVMFPKKWTCHLHVFFYHLLSFVKKTKYNYQSSQFLLFQLWLKLNVLTWLLIVWSKHWVKYCPKLFASMSKFSFESCSTANERKQNA